MRKSDFLFVLFSFLIWRVVLFVFLFLAIRYVPLQKNFLGGGMANYLANPWLWSWLNFDGEHYLAVAQAGYQPLTYFYFPVFPLIAKFLGNLIGGGLVNYALAGLIISNIAFLAGLVGLFKLISLNFSKEVAKTGVLLLLFFPASFFFASYYTESVFFALVVWSFYFARKGVWIWAGVLGGVSSAVRIIGVALLPSFLAEKKRKWPILLVPLGILAYMYYLNVKTGDPLNFLNTISIFGTQRSSNFILLPQVFYRYVFKIIPFINYSYFPNVFTTYLEFVTGVVFLILSIISFWKLRLSWAVYLLLGYIIPTLSGSFSSLPRYVLVLFPAFILMGLYLNKSSKIWKIAIYSLLSVGLGLATVLFARGYWVS